MGFYEEFGDKLVVSEQKRKARLALEEKLKDSAMRYQNGTFDIKVTKGDGTKEYPFEIQITRQNYDDAVIIFCKDKELPCYKINVSDEISEMLWKLSNYLRYKLEVQFFEIHLR